MKYRIGILLAAAGGLLLSLSAALAQDQGAAAAEATPARPLLVAPHGLDRLVARADRDAGARFLNLYYHAENDTMRGPRGPAGLYQDDGERIAAAWRDLAETTRGVFAVRDSTFAQQDHPLGNEPFALMLPPAWITVAAAETARGAELRRPHTPSLVDDASWTALSVDEAFGSFPVDRTLFERASNASEGRSASERRRVLNARRTLRELGQYAQALAEVAGEGPEAVAQRGAELVSEADRRYFGDALRRERMVLLAYESPDAAQRAQGSGFVPAEGGETIPDELVTMVRDTVLRRRMADGEIALGTYDISDPDVRAHVISVLSGLVRRGDPVDTGSVWIFFTGAPGPDGTPTAGLEHLGTLKREARDLLINTGRVDFYSPVRLALPDTPAERAAAVAEALPAYEDARIFLPVDLDSAETRALMESATGSPVAVAPRTAR